MKQTHRAEFWLSEGRGVGGGRNWEFEMIRCKLLYVG